MQCFDSISNHLRFLLFLKAPFLRVLRKYFKDIDTGGLEWDVLSDTRIHPNGSPIAHSNVGIDSYDQL